MVKINEIDLSLQEETLKKMELNDVFDRGLWGENLSRFLAVILSCLERHDA